MPEVSWPAIRWSSISEAAVRVVVPGEGLVCWEWRVEREECRRE